MNSVGRLTDHPNMTIAFTVKVRKQLLYQGFCPIVGSVLKKRKGKKNNSKIIFLSS